MLTGYLQGCGASRNRQHTLPLTSTPPHPGDSGSVCARLHRNWTRHRPVKCWQPIECDPWGEWRVNDAGRGGLWEGEQPNPPSRSHRCALTLLCFYLRQHGLQERQRLPVVLSLHFYELRRHKSRRYPLPKAREHRPLCPWGSLPEGAGYSRGGGWSPYSFLNHPKP